MTADIEQLTDLWAEVDRCELCAQQYLSGELNLKHIWGAGKQVEPDIMFVLMNPIGRNTSLQPGYEGVRLPFAGNKFFWKVLADAGLFPAALLDKIIPKAWDDPMSSLVIDALVQRNLYITDLVKCPSPLARDPDKAQIEAGLVLLKRELEIVRPKLIVTFGKLVFEEITGQKIRLKDHLARLENNEIPLYPTRATLGASYEVFPSYFPTGRGNPKKAINCLKYLAEI